MEKKNASSAAVIPLLLLAACSSTFLFRPALAQSNGVYITTVPYHHQIKSYYCGPAALEMLFDFYGEDIPQTEIADVARTSADGTYTGDMVRATHFSDLSTSVGNEIPLQNITGYTARKLGYAAFEYGGMTIDQLKSLIDRGYPIIVLTTWHFRVVVGYDDSYFTFQDSYYGSMYNMTYYAFDTDWDYSGHWALLVVPWHVEISVPNSVTIGSVFTVSASITYPQVPPFPSDQYLASAVNATVSLPAELNLASGEAAKKAVGIDLFAPGDSRTVTWNVQANSLGNYAFSVEAEGDVTGFVWGIPVYPQSYDYEDRIGGIANHSLRVTRNPPTSDIAVTNVKPSKTVVGKGYKELIDVTVENHGDFDEEFNVTAYYNDTAITLPNGKNYTTVTLTAWSSTTITLTWNTMDAVKGKYTISACAIPVPGETDTADNTGTYTDGKVFVSTPGDVNADGTVDIVDAGGISAHWYPGPPIGPLGYNINYDIDGDGLIDIGDAGIVSAYWTGPPKGPLGSVRFL